MGLGEENHTWENWRRLWGWSCVRVEIEWEWRGCLRVETEWEWLGEWERHENGEVLYESERVSERGWESGLCESERVSESGEALISRKPYMKSSLRDSVYKWLPHGSTTSHINCHVTYKSMHKWSAYKSSLRDSISKWTQCRKNSKSNMIRTWKPSLWDLIYKP